MPQQLKCILLIFHVDCVFKTFATGRLIVRRTWACWRSSGRWKRRRRRCAFSWCKYVSHVSLITQNFLTRLSLFFTYSSDFVRVREEGEGDVHCDAVDVQYLCRSQFEVCVYLSCRLCFLLLSLPWRPPLSLSLKHTKIERRTAQLVWTISLHVWSFCIGGSLR